MILFKMLNRGVFSEINGCISTGKEANVYHAARHDTKRELAIKVFKTSILVFKDRDKYVTGEFRFRRGYNKHNPREMVKLWAEKEFRNLTRMRQAGVRCPEPVLLRSHVLVMDFIGTDGWGAPKLKDANISESKARELYRSCVTVMRNIYQKAKLVHGDFSEYNILYYEGDLVVIDVSQAVEHAHPHALEFLRMDITNINDFFGRKGVPVMTNRELFDFVTDILLADDDVDGRLEEIQRAVERRLANPASAEAVQEAEMEEALFMKAFIPTSLDQVVDMEHDIKLLNEGKSEKLYYTALTALTSGHEGGEVPVAGAAGAPDDGAAVPAPATESNEGGSGADVDGVNGEEGSDEEGEWVDRAEAVSETPEEKRLRKQAVREANREKRQTKTPKHIKKKANNRHKRK
jgi:RIO kinase 1